MKRAGLQTYSWPASSKGIMERVVVFDVNGTLLDMAGLVPGLVAASLPSEGLPLWFVTTVRDAMVASCTGRYFSFDRVAAEALRRVARLNGLDLSDEDAEAVVAGFEKLGPHGDVIPALERITAAGIRTAVLSNSSQRVLDAQIAHASLGEYFEHRVSVDDVGVFKPDPRVYWHAASVLRVPIESVWMVAAHQWDVSGAIRAGAHGALVNRDGLLSSPLDEAADVVGEDLIEVADRLIEQ